MVLAGVVAVVFVATLVRSTFGFGEALIAVPLLALFLPVQVAAPLAVLVSITVAAIVIAQDWREVHFRSAAWLVAATVVGIPIGLWLLTSIDARVVKAALGLIIAAFALWSLRRRAPRELERDAMPWMLGCGLVAGVLGGAYGMNGPPLVVYGALRGWSAQRFRATLQAYFLPASVLGMAGYAVAGLWSHGVTHDYLVSLPATIGATLLGRVLNARLRGPSFLRWVYGALVLTGVALVGQSVRGAL